MKKTISIIGATGSIGLSTLNIIDNKKNLFNINLLSAKKNFKTICLQIKKYSPKIYVITDNNVFQKVKKRFIKKNKKILNNFSEIIKKKNLISPLQQYQV